MSWSSIKTEGLVLAVVPVREADRRYAILTPQHGKLDVLGRGAQKGLAKLAAHLEPFGLVQVEFIRGRRSTTVISVDRSHIFRNLAANLERRLLATTSLTLLDRFTRELAEDEVLYHDAVSWMHFLDVDAPLSSTRATFFLGAFLLRLLKRQGYDISLLRCVGCREDIMPLAFRWHAGKGGLVCTDCVRRDPAEWFSARSAEEEVIKLLRFARDAGYDDLTRPSLKATDMETFANMVHDLVAFHLPGYYNRPFWEGILADED